MMEHLCGATWGLDRRWPPRVPQVGELLESDGFAVVAVAVGGRIREARQMAAPAVQHVELCCTQVT
jgi:hypothetical protein